MKKMSDKVVIGGGMGRKIGTIEIAEDGQGASKDAHILLEVLTSCIPSVTYHLLRNLLKEYDKCSTHDDYDRLMNRKY
jgi:hypothetical protein